MLCTDVMQNPKSEAEADFVGKYTTPVGLSVCITFKIFICCLIAYIILKVLWLLCDKIFCEHFVDNDCDVCSLLYCY